MIDAVARHLNPGVPITAACLASAALSFGQSNDITVLTLTRIVEPGQS
jgi:hypothetical protein